MANALASMLRLSQRGNVVARFLQPPMTLGVKARFLVGLRGNDVIGRGFCDLPSQPSRSNKPRPGNTHFPFQTRASAYHIYMSNKKPNKLKNPKGHQVKSPKRSSFEESLKNVSNVKFRDKRSANAKVNKTQSGSSKRNQTYLLQESMERYLARLRSANLSRSVDKPGSQGASLKEVLAGQAFISKDGYVVSTVERANGPSAFSRPSNEGEDRRIAKESKQNEATYSLSDASNPSVIVAPAKDPIPESWLDVYFAERGKPKKAEGVDETGREESLVDGTGISQSFSNSHRHNEAATMKKDADGFWRQYNVEDFEPQSVVNSIKPLEAMTKNCCSQRTVHEPQLLIKPQEMAKGKSKNKSNAATSPNQSDLVGKDLASLKSPFNSSRFALNAESKEGNGITEGAIRDDDSVRNLPNENKVKPLLYVMPSEVTKRVPSSSNNAPINSYDDQWESLNMFGIEPKRAKKRKYPKKQKFPRKSTAEEKEDWAREFKNVAKAKLEAAQKELQKRDLTAQYIEYLNKTYSTPIKREKSTVKRSKSVPAYSFESVIPTAASVRGNGNVSAKKGKIIKRPTSPPRPEEGERVVRNKHQKRPLSLGQNTYVTNALGNKMFSQKTPNSNRTYPRLKSPPLSTNKSLTAVGNVSSGPVENGFVFEPNSDILKNHSVALQTESSQPGRSGILMLETVKPSVSADSHPKGNPTRQGEKQFPVHFTKASRSNPLATSSTRNAANGDNSALDTLAGMDQHLFGNKAALDFNRDVCKTYRGEPARESSWTQYKSVSTGSSCEDAISGAQRLWAYDSGISPFPMKAKDKKSKKKQRRNKENNSSLSSAGKGKTWSTSLDGFATMTAKPCEGSNKSTTPSSGKRRNAFFSNGTNDCSDRSNNNLKTGGNDVILPGNRSRSQSNQDFLDEQMRRYEMALARYNEKSRKDRTVRWDKKDRTRRDKSRRKGGKKKQASEKSRQ